MGAGKIAGNHGDGCRGADFGECHRAGRRRQADGLWLLGQRLHGARPGARARDRPLGGRHARHSAVLGTVSRGDRGVAPRHTRRHRRRPGGSGEPGRDQDDQQGVEQHPAFVSSSGVMARTPSSAPRGRWSPGSSTASSSRSETSRGAHGWIATRLRSRSSSGSRLRSSMSCIAGIWQSGQGTASGCRCQRRRGSPSAHSPSPTGGRGLREGSRGKAGGQVDSSRACAGPARSDNFRAHPGLRPP